MQDWEKYATRAGAYKGGFKQGFCIGVLAGAVIVFAGYWFQ